MKLDSAIEAAPNKLAVPDKLAAPTLDRSPVYSKAKPDTAVATLVLAVDSLMSVEPAVELLATVHMCCALARSLAGHTIAEQAVAPASAIAAFANLGDTDSIDQQDTIALADNIGLGELRLFALHP